MCRILFRGTAFPMLLYQMMLPSITAAAQFYAPTSDRARKPFSLPALSEKERKELLEGGAA